MVMTQSYLNPGPTALETTFNFPVDSDFAIAKLVIDYTDENGETS